MIKEGIVTVLLTTSLGEIKIELNKELAPITTQNFVKYVESGFYDQTIFHRVIENFVIQGGGHNEDMSMKDRDLESIQNEANNGLKNERGSIAMARTAEPHSASSTLDSKEFFAKKLNEKIEESILKKPQQYLWHHRRFKSQKPEIYD